MSKVIRGEKILNRLVTEQKITPCGRDWIIAAVDPFHDNQLANLEGWPDVECGASVIRCIKQSVSVSVPSTVTAGSNWTCHVIQWPWLNGSSSFTITGTRSGGSYSLPTPVNISSAAVGGLQIYGMPDGAPLDVLQPSAGSVRQIGRLDIDPTYTQGSGRLVGCGFEVHNTTAELYLQGTCTAYRQQADFPAKTDYFGYTTSTNAYTSFSGVNMRYPPISQAEAMLLQGSRQWTAEEGVYMAGQFMTMENPAYPIDASSPVILGTASDDVEGSIATSLVNIPVSGPVGPGSLCSVASNRVHPIHQSGCIFTGLSYQSTLTINWNVYYESFPSAAEPSIVVLAKPSARYDFDAMQLYSRIISELPVGVPVRENGLGDWFLDAATKAAQYIGPVLTALPHPIAKGAGVALSYLGQTGGKYVKEQQSQPPNAWEQPGPNGAVGNERSRPIKAKAKKKKKAKAQLAKK